MDGNGDDGILVGLVLKGLCALLRLYISDSMPDFFVWSQAQRKINHFVFEIQDGIYSKVVMLSSTKNPLSLMRSIIYA